MLLRCLLKSLVSGVSPRWVISLGISLLSPSLCQCEGLNGCTVKRVRMWSPGCLDPALCEEQTYYSLILKTYLQVSASTATGFIFFPFLLHKA